MDRDLLSIRLDRVIDGDLLTPERRKPGVSFHASYPMLSDLDQNNKDEIQSKERTKRSERRDERDEKERDSSTVRCKKMIRVVQALYVCIYSHPHCHCLL